MRIGYFAKKAKYIVVNATLLCCIPVQTTLKAEEAGQTDYLSSLEGDMLKIDEEASINKQNVDYKPYIISVLTHEQLEKLGITTLRDALKLVPGVDISVGMMGVTYPVFRGSNPYAMESQLYIDGVSVNDAIFNAYYHSLDLPIEIIDRIEVVRGPGSLLSHELAFGGSINVITRAANPLNETEETRIFTAAGSNRYRMGGLQTLIKAGSWKIGGDAYYQDSSRHDWEGPDFLGSSREAYFDNENYAVGINARNGTWNLGGRFASQITGPSYGQMFTLSQDPSDYLDIRTDTVYADYKSYIGADTTLKLSGTVVEQHRKLKNKTLPDGITYMGKTFPFGRYFYVDYDERRTTGIVELENDGWDNLHLTGGIKRTVFSVLRDNAQMTMPGSAMLMSSDLISTNSRTITTGYGEATYSPMETTSFAAGFKYDDISDHGTKFSPRVSAVHLLDSNNILKAMYTRSYRLPSWREEYFYSAPQNYGFVDIETVNSYEVSYIRKLSSNDSFRVNLFYLLNEGQTELDAITKVATSRYDTTIRGGEVEWQYTLGESDQIGINYSYADGTIDGTGQPIPNSAKHMATLTNIYQIDDAWTTGSVVKYVGSRAREVGDTRSALDGYVTWDQSLMYHDYGRKYSVSLTVQNLLDETWYLPAVAGTYPNDFQQPGRTIWLKFEKSWQK
ncbi:MAG: TonB-dependent receptor plug domain-containing protein [Sulfuricurvum sp.]